MKTRVRKDNKGMSLVMVVGIVTIVTILVTIALAIALYNYQMKVTNKNSKNNFYDAEKVLDEIRLGLQKDVSNAMSVAYYETLENYAGKDLEESSDYFNERYLEVLKDAVASSAEKSEYDRDHLLGFLDEKVKKRTTLTTADEKKPYLNVNKTNGVTLKNLSLTYVNEEDYISSIRTDIQLKIPDINRSKYQTGSNLVQYALVAQEGVTVKEGTGNVTFDGNVYAGSSDTVGEESFTVENGKNVTVKKGKDLVAKDTIQVQAAALTLEEKATLWANDIEAEDVSEIELLGTSYVANDLTLRGSANVTIGGEYYGFGNPKAALLADSIKDLGVEVEEKIKNTPSDYSSSIIVNGLGSAGKSKLNLKSVRKLMLAGNAYIGESKVMMGESLTVKSNQIAYLVPESCMLGASNPMTAATRNEQMKLSESDTKEERENKENKYKKDLLEQVKKTVSGDVEEVVQLYSSRDDLYYYYMQFANAKAADTYFSAHYKSAASAKIKDYLQYYVENQEVKINQDAQKTSNGNILVYDESGISAIGDTIGEEDEDLSDNNEVQAQLASYQDIFQALNTNLSLDYSALTKAQRARAGVYANVFDEQKHRSELGTYGDCYYRGKSREEDRLAYVCIVNTNTAEENRALSLKKAIEDARASYLAQGLDIKVEMVITSDDILIDDDFEGLIICGGRAIIDPGASESLDMQLKSNPAKVAAVINEATREMPKNEVTREMPKVEYLKNVMYNPDQYAGEFLKADSRSDNYIKLEDLVVYKNWSKQ